MKTKIFLILSLVMTLGIVGCTSDFDENHNSQEEKFAVMKSKISSMAEEYGVSGNIRLTDDVVMKHLDDSETEIEDWMKAVAMVKGTFIGKKEGNRYRFYRLNRKTRVGSENETWSEFFTDRAVKDEYTIYFNLYAEYNDDETSKIEISNISLSYAYYKDGDYKGRREEEHLSSNNESFVFGGSNHGFDFYCTIHSNDLDCDWHLTCNYGGYQLGCSLT